MAYRSSFFITFVENFCWIGCFCGYLVLGHKNKIESDGVLNVVLSEKRRHGGEMKGRINKLGSSCIVAAAQFKCKAKTVNINYSL